MVTASADKPIQHVSDTAFWIAAYRYQEGNRKDALFHDPLAAVLAGSRGEEIAKRMNAEEVRWSVTIRTVIIDRYLSERIAEGVDIVLNLGAGLDTRPYRMNLPSHLKWIEADFAHMIQFKTERLAQEIPKCSLERIAVDLSDEIARNKFLAEVNTKGKNILVLTEGVVPYLTNEQAASLASGLALQSNFRWWVVDYFSQYFLKLLRKGRIAKLLKDNAPFQFFPKDWAAFYGGRGWEPKELRYLPIESFSLGRQIPTRWYYRFLAIFLSRSKKEHLLRMSGYALLQKKRS